MKLLKPISLQQARLGEGRVIYAIGDIHGRLDLLHLLLDKISDDRSRLSSDYEAHIIFLGDYLDRGPACKELIEFLRNPIDIDAICHFLMGNHEEAALKFMHNPKISGRWLVYGGYETLSSYNVNIMSDGCLSEDKEQLAKAFKANMPDVHFDFLNNLKSTVSFDDYMFVHAGVSPEHPLDQQNIRDMHWIREEFLNHEGLYDKIIVHGHTISVQVEFKENRIGLDTGAYESECLSCVKLIGDKKDVIQT